LNTYQSSDEIITRAKPEFSKQYQNKYKECYVLITGEEIILKNFLEFNLKSLTNNEDLRNKLKELYRDDLMQTQK
jgi:hypothetical protein